MQTHQLSVSYDAFTYASTSFSAHISASVELLSVNFSSFLCFFSCCFNVLKWLHFTTNTHNQFHCFHASIPLFTPPKKLILVTPFLLFRLLPVQECSWAPALTPISVVPSRCGVAAGEVRFCVYVVLRLKRTCTNICILFCFCLMFSHDHKKNP